jgi:N6-adenosine-specific RNA methylase IME4
MNIEFIKSNYFDIFICSGLVFASLSRVFYSSLRDKEIHDLPINEVFEYTLILYELSSVYFIFFTNENIRKYYYKIYIAACITISMYYLSKMSLENIFTELTKLSIFPNDFRVMWYHLVYVYILIYLVYIK